MGLRSSKIMNISIAYRNSHKLLFKRFPSITQLLAVGPITHCIRFTSVTISILLCEIVVIDYFNFLSVESKHFSFLNSKTSVKSYSSGPRGLRTAHVDYISQMLRGAPTGSGRSISRLHAEAKRFYPGPWRFSFLSRRLPLRSAAGPCAQCAALF